MNDNPDNLLLVQLRKVMQTINLLGGNTIKILKFLKKAQTSPKWNVNTCTFLLFANVPQIHLENTLKIQWVIWSMPKEH